MEHQDTIALFVIFVVAILAIVMLSGFSLDFSAGDRSNILGSAKYATIPAVAESYTSLSGSSDASISSGSASADKPRCPKEDFTMAFILIGETKADFTRVRIKKLNQIKEFFSKDFHTATRKLATMDTTYPVTTMLSEGLMTSNNNIDVKEVAKKFYEEHPAKFDFISIYTTFDVPQTQYHLTVINYIENGGLNPFDLSRLYGSKNLLGINHMKNIDMYNPDPDYFRSSGLLHETGHQWASYTGDDYGTPGTPLPILAGGRIHWHCVLELDDISTGERDPIGGCNWEEIETNNTFNKTFVRVDVYPKVPTYHQLTLYLMNLLPKERVPEIRMVLPLVDPPYWQYYDPIQATTDTLLVDDIIAEYGEVKCVDYIIPY